MFDEGDARAAEVKRKVENDFIRMASIGAWPPEEKSDAYEDKKTVCGERLEHAFDFMEAAFANGQELVIFVTGLNTGEASVEFLKEYNCERYYRYNKELLFDNQENEMKEVLGK